MGAKQAAPTWKTAPVQAWEAHAGRVYPIPAFIVVEDAEKKWRECREELKELKKFFGERNWEKWAS